MNKATTIKIKRFIKSMEENALFALKHNGKSSTVGQKAIEQLKEINNL